MGVKRSAGSIRMASFDSLFDVGGQTGDGGENVREVALPELFPFRGHPFKVLDDDSMVEMAESVREYGVLVPGIARPRAEGGYELVAGHRRKRASELAGRETMPVIIRELDDDEAVLFMVDSNLQREDILPSEKAWAYRMKLDALKHQGVKDTSRQVGEKCSVDALSGNAEDSARNIHRYIRLTELEPVLLQMVDDRELPFNTAVELSYLTGAEQGNLLEVMGRLSTAPSLEQARRLKQYSKEGRLSADVLDAVLAEAHPAPVQVTLKKDRLTKYFPPGYTQKQVEEVIFSLLEKWREQNG